jgi:non-homologous end joining protein Ku
VPAGEVQAKELDAREAAHRADGDDVFEPSKFRDTVRERVMEAIQRKVDGQDITADVDA